MKPVRLEVVGFLSYREPTLIDFDGLSAVAIIGENGSGKTSLVEAMSWALFGKGRGRGPDDFVSDGGDGCRVTFDFALDGREYRVDRQRKMAKSSTSSLELFVNAGTDEAAGIPQDEFEPIGGDAIAETQTAIEQLLGMDFDTWSATSFIGQGKADAFTNLKPADRKDLLAEILGLRNYQILADRVRDVAKILAGKLGEIESRIPALERTIEDWDASELAKATEELEGSKLAQRAADEELEVARAALDEARELISQIEDLRRELRAFQEQRRERGMQAERDERRIAGDLKRVEAELEAVKREVTGLEDIHERIRAQQEAAAVSESEVQDLAGQLERAQALVGEQREASKEARTKIATTEEHMAASLERFELLNTTEDPSCPACGQGLDFDSRMKVLDDIRIERSRSAIEHSRLTSLAASATATAAAHQEAADRLRDEIDAARTRGLASQRALSALEATQDRAPELEGRAEGLEARRRALVTEHNAARVLAEELQKPTSDEDEITAEITALTPAVDPIAQATTNVSDAEHRARQAQELVAAAAVAQARAEDRAKVIDQAREDLETKRALTADLTLRARRLDVLAAAFSRDGIPALLVETAVPDLEAEANSLLGQLTSERFSVRIESLKATKAGEIREALDVVVSDDRSERPLEVLSGGERQCVDLSLRIALARLLAHRAGRQIETLIVDEGFTALDVAHKQRTIEAIHGLLGEFEIVLFVTHLQDLADAFPSQIQVRREGGTSHVVVGGA